MFITKWTDFSILVTNAELIYRAVNIQPEKGEK